MRKLFFFLAFFIFILPLQAQIDFANHQQAAIFINQALEQIDAENFDEAINKLSSAIILDSTIRSAYLSMFTAGYQSGNTEATKVYLNKAKLIFVEDDEISYYLGRIYQKEQDYNSAIAEYSEAIKFSKINGEDFLIVYDYYSSRGVCYLKQNKYDEALDDFNYSIQLNDMKANVYANRGIALYLLKRTEEACESWKKASKLGEISVVKYIEKHCH